MSKKPETDSFVTEITPRSQDFSKWYLDVVRKAERLAPGDIVEIRLVIGH